MKKLIAVVSIMLFSSTSFACISTPTIYLSDETEIGLLEAEFAKSDVDRRRLIEDIMWSMLNAPEFLYLD